MAYALLITSAAHQDLDNALHYITETLANPTAASALLNEIESCYNQICQFPFSYETCRDINLQHKGYRKAPIGNYILVYRPDETLQKVYVLRFFYGRSDYEKIL